MKINCVWEHNGNDTLLYMVDFPGAFTRGESKIIALNKVTKEIHSYAQWLGMLAPVIDEIEIVQDAPCELAICDADSEVLFKNEGQPLTTEEYQKLKTVALKSAADFLSMYLSIPDKNQSITSLRKTFYGQVPRTAEEMYLHTKNVNGYYFGEIGVNADNNGNIFECRQRGFELLEKQKNFLSTSVTEGSYSEMWSLRKALRRFIWHDRIHAKAMYKRAVNIWGKETVKNPFYF